jgi:predicted nucleic acid-binding Zn ribbon protein
MPTYDYRCEANNKIYEVKHPMSLSPKTWAELCKVTGMEMKNIPGNTPVTKVFNTIGVVKPTSLKTLGLQPPCKADGCGGGACEM